jgi:hypothetical protein
MYRWFLTELQKKNYIFNQVDFSKPSFPVAPSGDKKVFATKQTQFCMSRQKVSRFNQVFN